MQGRAGILYFGLVMIGVTATGTLALALPCSLTDTDMQSLAHPGCDNCKPVTETGLENLSATDQKSLCATRHFYSVMRLSADAGNCSDFPYSQEARPSHKPTRLR
jgi:hypothetical protein